MRTQSFLVLDKIIFQEEMGRLLPDFRQKKFLVAASGGVDSMVLIDLMLVSKIDFEIAHVNYRLRGKDSDLDEEIVRKIAQEHSVKLHVFSVSSKEKIPDKSIQLWARDLRYRFFFDILQNRGLQSVVMAHNLNDQLETFIINLSKASGIRGLSGMPANENAIIRPLLHFCRKDIYNYAKKKNILFREDLSNLKKDYLRNKIRLDVIPELLKINPLFLENFRRSINYLEQNRLLTEEFVEEIFRAMILNQGEAFVVLDREKFSCQNDFVKFEILRKFGFRDGYEIKKIFIAASGKFFLSTSHKLFVEKDRFCLYQKTFLPQYSKDQDECVILPLEERLLYPFPVMLSKHNFRTKTKFWELDASEINLPLKLRKNFSTDIFYPKGMQGRKKVSKFLKDKKISIFDRPAVWVLVDGKNRIIGVPPFRQDGRFAKSHTTVDSLYFYYDDI